MMPAAELTGRVALVTGASSGIGRRIAIDLARGGASLVVNYRDNGAGAEATVEAIAQAGAGPAIAVQADVGLSADVERLFATAEAAYAPPDILINNAGALGGRVPLAEMTDQQFDAVLRNNLCSTFYCCRRALSGMLERGSGRIVNISTSAARGGGNPGIGAYAAAKAGVSTLTRSLAKEVALRGITVNAVSPGVIGTRIHEATPREVFERIVAKIPVGRAGSPADVSAAVLFLVSNAASYVTGETIEVNGGLIMD